MNLSRRDFITYLLLPLGGLTLYKGFEGFFEGPAANPALARGFRVDSTVQTNTSVQPIQFHNGVVVAEKIVGDVAFLPTPNTKVERMIAAGGPYLLFIVTTSECDIVLNITTDSSNFYYNGRTHPTMESARNMILSNGVTLDGSPVVNEVPLAFWVPEGTEVNISLESPNSVGARIQFGEAPEGVTAEQIGISMILD